MPNIPGAIKQLPKDVAGVIGEAAASVVDQVGQDIEQAIVGPTPPPKPQDPAVQAQKKADEQKRLNWAWGVIERNKQKLSDDLSKIDAEKKQKKLQEEQIDEQKKENKKIEMTQRSNLKAQQLASKQTAENKGKGLGG
jgi:hypothetical protein